MACEEDARNAVVLARYASLGRLDGGDSQLDVECAGTVLVVRLGVAARTLEPELASLSAVVLHALRASSGFYNVHSSGPGANAILDCLRLLDLHSNVRGVSGRSSIFCDNGCRCMGWNSVMGLVRWLIRQSLALP